MYKIYNNFLFWVRLRQIRPKSIMKKAVHLQLLRRWTKSCGVLLWPFKSILIESSFGWFFWFSVFLPKNLWIFLNFLLYQFCRELGCRIGKQWIFSVHYWFSFCLWSGRISVKKSTYYWSKTGERRRQLQKRHLKTEFTLLQTLSRLFHFV